MANKFLSEAEIAARIYQEEEDPPPIDEDDGNEGWLFMLFANGFFHLH
jgi:hypothetical protein